MSQILIKGFRIRYNSLRCEQCGIKIEDDDLYYSKRRTNHTVSYCIKCAVMLNIVTEEEIEERMIYYKDRGYNNG